MDSNELKKAYRFNVNEERGIVTCYMTVDDFISCMLSPMADKYSKAAKSPSAENAIWNFILDMRDCREFFKKGALIAHARCNMEEDIFDEEFGKKLAQRKLELKLAELRKKTCEDVASQFWDLAHYMYEKAEKIEKYILSRRESINSLIEWGPERQ